MNRIRILTVLLLTAFSCGGGQKRPTEKNSEIASATLALEINAPEQNGIKALTSCKDGLYHFSRLGLACRDGDLDMVKTRITNGDDRSRCMVDEIYEYDAYYLAVDSRNLKLLRYLAGLGDDVNCYYGEHGISLLTLACMIEDHALACEMAMILLDAGADVNAGIDEPSPEGPQIPLFAAITNGNVRLLRLLIERNVRFHTTLGDDKHTIIWDFICGYPEAGLKPVDNSREIETILTEWQLETNSSIDDSWIGVYSWEERSIEGEYESYNISITRDSCVFLGFGRLYYRNVLCTARSDGDKLNIHWLKRLDGGGDYLAQCDTLVKLIRRDNDYFVVLNEANDMPWREWKIKELPIEKTEPI